MRRVSVSPALALGGLVATTFAARLALALQFDHPVAFVDELVHAGAAKRLALGESAAVPGASHGYGLGYPALIAPLYTVAGNPEAAYPWVKAFNALAFALAVLPAYALARRVAGRRLAFGAAALTALLPAGAYASFVLTESLALLAFLVACLAIVRMVESPAVWRQAVALAACAAAVEVRRQNIVLVGALVLAPAGVALAERSQRLIRLLWPVWTVLGSALAVGGVWLGTTGSTRDAVGGYSVLARGYDVVDTLSWGRILAISLIPAAGVLPVVLAPFGLRALLRRGSTPGARALAWTAIATLVLVLAQVALFSTTEYSLERVHERYLTYVAPLLLAVLAGWFARGMPGGVRAAGLAVVAAALLPWALPGIGGVAPSGFDNPALAALGYPANPGVIGGGRLVPSVVCGLVALAGLFAVTRRSALPAFAAVGALLLVVGALHHRDLRTAEADVQEWATGGTGGPRDWIDRAIGAETPVTLLSVAPRASCRTAEDDDVVGRATLWNVSFYNSGPVRVAAIGKRPSTHLPLDAVTPGADGTLLASGRPLPPGYVVVDSRVSLRGRRVAADPATTATLWRTTGSPALTLTVAGARAAVCGRSAGRS